jgi:hypothetical protein
VDNGGGASWDRVSGLDLGVGVVRCFLLCHNVLGHLLVVQFFDAWVRHDWSYEDLVSAVVFFTPILDENPKLCGRHCSILAGRLFMESQIKAAQKWALTYLGIFNVLKLESIYCYLVGVDDRMLGFARSLSFRLSLNE